MGSETQRHGKFAWWAEVLRLRQVEVRVLGNTTKSWDKITRGWSEVTQIWGQAVEGRSKITQDWGIVVVNINTHPS